MKNLMDAHKRENRKNDPFGIGKFMEKGRIVESLFKTLAEKRGWKVIDAAPQQDMHEHWDKLITKGDTNLRVEVKGQKKSARWDMEYDQEWVWIELKGVADKGWLHGKADLIAFEFNDRFVIIERLKLIEIVNKLVDFKVKVYHPHEVKYNLFNRPTRTDLLTKINIKDIEPEKWDEWSK